jgi:DNA-binding NtrC family response regulator/tetratricopeptide (TPR) repeat protein
MSASPAEQLVFTGRFIEASHYLANQQQLTPVERALQAWSELELGRPERAYKAASALIKSGGDPRAKAFAELTAGRALGRIGSLEQAVAHTRRAVHEIAGCDPHLQAEFLAHHIYLLFFVGIEIGFAELPLLRQVALFRGSRSGLVEYHLCRARVAASRRLYEVASAEASIAEALLSDHSNINHLWRLREIQAHIALQELKFDEAIRRFSECLSAAKEMGVAHRVTYARANLASACTDFGRFAKARSLIEEANRDFPQLSRVRFALLSTGLQLGIATGDRQFVDQILAEATVALSSIGDEQWNYRLAFEYQRAKWLVREGASEQALELAGAALERSLKFGDRDLLGRFSLLRAEALALAGKLSDAVSEFSKSCVSTDRPSVGVVAEMMRIASVLSSTTDTAFALQCSRCAQDLLESAELYGLKVEITPMLERLKGARVPKARHAADFVLIRTAHLLHLRGNPILLAKELAGLLSSLDSGLRTCVKRVSVQGEEIVWTSDKRADSSRKPDDPSIQVGQGRDGDYFLCTSAPTSPRSAILWNAIKQLIGATHSGTLTHDQAAQPLESLFSDSQPLQMGMVTAAEATLRLVETTRKLAPSSITVLITGETGTGKELFAKALHDYSPRGDKPFIPYNCSAVSKDMLDAQLFGYRKGAFTGAADAFPGVIRAAHGGTLLLDEIGEVALDVQPKLLRFLESGEIHPLGEPRPVAVDVRVVAATNANLEQMVDEGRFREDLFYRLNVVRLHVPPLRERREEIPPLVQHYLDKGSREARKTGLRISDETMEYLILFNWPGNVRQLANEVRRMVALAESNAVLMPEHLSAEIAASRRTIPASDRYIAPTEFVVRIDQPMSAAVEHLERSMIGYAMKLSGGRVEDAAARLGLSRKGLYLKRQRLDLQDAEADRQSGISA